MSKLTDNGIQFDMRVWTNVGMISEVKYAVQEAVARQFMLDNISGPKTEIDVLLFRGKAKISR